MDSALERVRLRHLRESNPAKPVYRSWNEVPKTLKTRRQWKESARQVLPKQEPSAFVLWKTRGRHWHSERGSDGSEKWHAEHLTIEKQVKLFTAEQTRPYKGSRVGHASDIFVKTFVRDANRDKFLYNDGGWKTYAGRITESQVKDHWTWAEAYGVFGGKWTRFAAVDLDLHQGDQAVFLDQLRVLLDEFHGDCRCHYQVADENANGIHLILVFRHRVRVESVRATLRGRLRKLDQQHLELAERAHRAGMKSFGNLEVFPSTTHGFRLPLCRGRTMLLNQPLNPVYDRRRKRHVADVLEYASWLTKPSGYMPIEDVIEYVRSRLRPPRNLVNSRCSAAGHTLTQAKPKIPAASTQMRKKETSFLGQLRGQFASKLVAFWSGEVNEPDSLNMAVSLLARPLPHYELGEQQAIELIERYIDELPSTTFSDRLSGGRRADVSRVVKHTVAKVYGGNSGQPDPTASNDKLAATVAAWRRRGFDLTDKTTWKRAAGRSTPSLGPDFEWPDEFRSNLDDLALLLNTDSTTTSLAAKYILRLVSSHPGELAITYIKSILVGFGVRCGHHGKVNAFIDRLLTWKWIYVRAEHRWHGRGSGERGRARAYGIGEAMQHVLRQNTAASTINSANKIPELQWISQEDLLKIVGADEATEGEEVLLGQTEK